MSQILALQQLETEPDGFWCFSFASSDWSILTE